MHRFPTRSATVFASALALSLLAGCATQDPYTGEQKTSNATKGAAIGSALGAITGALATNRGEGQRTRSVLVGAALGGAVGGGAGHYMDQQEAQLRQRLRSTGVSVTRAGNQIILNMPGNITFDTDRSSISSSFYPVLNSVGLVLKEFDKTQVEVGGHTDSTGAADYNQELSVKRAQSVADYLAGQGVNRVRLEVRGYGEESPIAANDTEQGRAANRRVEVIILPI